jgi:hypothetical protein
MGRQGKEIRTAEMKDEIQQLEQMRERADDVWIERIDARILWLKAQLEKKQ